MASFPGRRRFELSSAEIVAEYCDELDDDLLDALITAAALVARADNWVEPVERAHLLDFVDRHDFLSAPSKAETSELFARRIGELRESAGLAAAAIRLNRVAGRDSAQLVLDLGEEMAAADCRLDPREERMLAFIRSALKPTFASRDRAKAVV